MSSANVLTGWPITYNWLTTPTVLTSRLAAISHRTSTLLFADWLTVVPNLSRTDLAENTTVHCCSSIGSVGTCFFAKPLLGNGSYILLISRSLPSNGSTWYSVYTSVWIYSIILLELGNSFILIFGKPCYMVEEINFARRGMDYYCIKCLV
jgi:hypothetical protein